MKCRNANVRDIQTGTQKRGLISLSVFVLTLRPSHYGDSLYTVTVISGTISIHGSTSRETSLTSFMLPCFCDCNVFGSLSVRKTLGSGWVIIQCFTELPVCHAVVHVSFLNICNGVLNWSVFTDKLVWMGIWTGPLCLSIPRIPLWTLSGFRFCAALPVSIKRSVGCRVWDCATGRDGRLRSWMPKPSILLHLCFCLWASLRLC